MMFYKQSPHGYEDDITRRHNPGRMSSGPVSDRGENDAANSAAKMYYQLNGLTMRLADKERKITEYDRQIKLLTGEYDITKTKIATEKDKLDAATAKNKELRAMLNYVMQT